MNVLISHKTYHLIKTVFYFTSFLSFLYVLLNFPCNPDSLSYINRKNKKAYSFKRNIFLKDTFLAEFVSIA